MEQYQCTERDRLAALERRDDELADSIGKMREDTATMKGRVSVLMAIGVSNLLALLTIVGLLITLLRNGNQ